jgi:hypothetical protein
MSADAQAKPVERLFPFALRARILVVGRDTLLRGKGGLHFILVTTDLSEQSRKRVLADFSHYPVVQRYASADLERFFELRGTKVVGFKKSGLAQSIYAELKEDRLNKPPPKTSPQQPLSGADAQGITEPRPSSEFGNPGRCASGMTRVDQ